MAQTANAIVQMRDFGGLLPIPVATNIVIYQGQTVFVNSGGFGASTGVQVAGIAKDQVDNTGGGNGAKTVEVYSKCVVRRNHSGLVQADVGKALEASDNNTVALLTSGTPCGRMAAYVSASEVEVQLNGIGYQ